MEIEESKVICVFDLSNGRKELPLPEMEKTVSEKSLEKIRFQIQDTSSMSSLADITWTCQAGSLIWEFRVHQHIGDI